MWHFKKGYSCHSLYRVFLSARYISLHLCCWCTIYLMITLALEHWAKESCHMLRKCVFPCPQLWVDILTFNHLSHILAPFTQIPSLPFAQLASPEPILAPFPTLIYPSSVLSPNLATLIVRRTQKSELRNNAIFHNKVTQVTMTK